MLPRRIDTKIDIYLIDYGEELTVDIKSLYCLPRKYALLKAQAIPVGIANCYNKITKNDLLENLEDPWSNDNGCETVCNYLNDLKNNKLHRESGLVFQIESGYDNFNLPPQHPKIDLTYHTKLDEDKENNINNNDNNQIDKQMSRSNSSSFLHENKPWPINPQNVEEVCRLKSGLYPNEPHFLGQLYLYQSKSNDLDLNFRHYLINEKKSCVADLEEFMKLKQEAYQAKENELRDKQITTEAPKAEVENNKEAEENEKPLTLSQNMLTFTQMRKSNQTLADLLTILSSLKDTSFRV